MMLDQALWNVRPGGALPVEAWSEPEPRPLVLLPRRYSKALERLASAIDDAAWSGVGYLCYSQGRYNRYADILARFAEVQLCLVDAHTGYPLAVATCAPITCPDFDALPQEGWDWLAEAAVARPREDPDALGVLAVSVPAPHRRMGYGTRMLLSLREFAERRGFKALVSPVRPIAKSRHPMAPMAEYAGWKDLRGRPYDPWLRAHVECGGEILRACERSMVIEEPIAFWETWAGRRFSGPGAYALEAAIAPLWIDCEAGTGRYQEAHVWVAHRL
jgi:GNAT superfamily N-acetyltransferase